MNRTRRLTPPFPDPDPFASDTYLALPLSVTVIAAPYLHRLASLTIGTSQFQHGRPKRTSIHPFRRHHRPQAYSALVVCGPSVPAPTRRLCTGPLRPIFDWVRVAPFFFY